MYDLRKRDLFVLSWARVRRVMRESILCFCMSEVISSFRSLTAGSQVFALLMLFLCVILHTMSSGKSLQLLCILPFGMLCVSAISDVCEKSVGSVYIGGYGGLSGSGHCVFRELCPVSFLVVGEYL